MNKKKITRTCFVCNKKLTMTLMSYRRHMKFHRLKSDEITAMKNGMDSAVFLNKQRAYQKWREKNYGARRRAYEAQQMENLQKCFVGGAPLVKKLTLRPSSAHYYIFHVDFNAPMTPFEDRILEVYRTGIKLVLNIGGCMVKQEEWARLLTRRHLNDEVINAFVYLFRLFPRVGALSSFFFNLLETNRLSVRKACRWLANSQIVLNQVESIILPIHTGNNRRGHWTLVWIDFVHKQFKYIDSMNSGYRRGMYVLTTLRRFFAELNIELSIGDDGATKDLKFLEWRLMPSSISYPRQRDVLTCGFYVLAAAFDILRGKNFSLTHEQIPLFSKHLLLVLHRTCHGISKDYIPSQGSTNRQVSTQLHAHRDVHRWNGPFKEFCTICHVGFNSKSSLQDHKKCTQHRERVTEAYQCIICYCNTNSPAAWESHMRGRDHHRKVRSMFYRIQNHCMDVKTKDWEKVLYESKDLPSWPQWLMLSYWRWIYPEKLSVNNPHEQVVPGGEAVFQYGLQTLHKYENDAQKKEAVKLLKVASEENIGSAKYVLACILWERKHNVSEVKKLLWESIKFGEKRAFLQLATVKQHEEDSQQNRNTILELLSFAIQAGDSAAGEPLVSYARRRDLLT